MRSIVDLHLGPAFIELAKAHDVVAECRDVVDTVQDAVLTGLPLEHNRADALDLYP